MKTQQFKQKIIFVCLSNRFLKNFSQSFAERFDFYYLDIDKFIEYNMVDKEKMEVICGVEYIDNQEKKIMNSIEEYEDTIFSIGFSNFVRNHNLYFKNFLTIYLSIPQKILLKEKRIEEEIDNTFLNELVFDERSKFLKKNCNISFDCAITNVEAQVEVLASLIM